jgi:molybdopterin-guanine dinucleotide biosynthesis protein A
MTVLLLCSYRETDTGEAALGLTRDAEGRLLLDRQIEDLQALGFDVTCVLAGESADEQLRQCRRLREVELVFDTAAPLSLLSNAREGARSAPHEACFVLPVEVPVPAREVWDFLRTQYASIGFNAETSVIQAEGAPCHYGFPLLFTRQGCEQLQSAENLSGLVDARLGYLRLALESKPL